MKFQTIFSVLVSIFILFTGCSKEDENDNVNVEVKTTGELEFKTTNPMADGSKSTLALTSSTSNPQLVGDSTITHTTSFKLCVGDVWVSTGEVKAGQANDMEWMRLTSVTNTDQKLFEDYSFSKVELPAGTYKSIKLTFRNVFYRYAQLVSNPEISYELLETMGSWTSPCDENDTTWARTNYFGFDGNHILNDNGIFELVSEGEKLGGFTIEPGEKVTVSWRLGAGVTEPCIAYLIDENANLEWDCGVDRMEFECPPEVEYMWDFVIEYK